MEEKDYIIKDLNKLSYLQDELIKVLLIQTMDLSMMSKIELGDDVLLEIKRLQREIGDVKKDLE